MSFISIFDVLGPNMIGPSSSHTAGACSIALIARKMLGEPVRQVEFTLYGSFAKTYQGHGTDRALLGGIMGFSTEDERIPQAYTLAEQQGILFDFFYNHTETELHPNTVDIHLTDIHGHSFSLRGESIGGGKIRISRINGIDVDFSGDYNSPQRPDRHGGPHYPLSQRGQGQYCVYAAFPGGKGGNRIQHCRV